ncbi:MAG: porin family protein, partial [Flavihumibacter sp.]
QKPEVGVTGQLDMYSIKGDGLQKSFHIGYNAGIYADWKIYRKWSFQPQVLFTQKNIQVGSDFKDKFPDISRGSIESVATLRGVTVPLQLGYAFTEQFSILAGPQYTRIVDAEAKLLRDDKKAFGKEDWGITGAAQWKLSKSFRLQARYTKGFSNLNTFSEQRTWKSRSMSLGLSWKLL